MPEGDLPLISLILELIPDISGQTLAEERLCAWRENRETIDVFWLLEVRSSFGFLLCYDILFRL